MAKDLSGSQVGMTPSDPINNPRPDVLRGRNVFPQSHLHLTTDRYGEYSPFFWAKCERGDVQNLHSLHNLHTFTMQTPMVSDVTMTKSFVKVPMQAIYPRNWEKMMTIPTQGDDIPSDNRALLDVTKLVRNLVDVYNNADLNNVDRFKALFLLDAICSHGSLFERFNMHLNFLFESPDYTRPVSFERIFDSILEKFFDFAASEVFYITLSEFGNTPVYVTDDPDLLILKSASEVYISRRRFIELMRQNRIVSFAGFTDFAEFGEFYYNSGYESSSSDSLDPYQKFINIEPIVSYQLACAQFGTNDHVDFIYSAQLYRENMQSLFIGFDTGFPSFIYNGVRTLFDVFSCHTFNELISRISNPITFDAAYDFFMNLFEYVPSLRNGDYFTIAKPRPLAVGEYSATVVDSSVSAIDVTRSIQMQRLLNRVNMVGRKLGDYLSGIYGGPLPEAPKDVPIFLTHQYFKIDGFEVNNTGSDQLDSSIPNITTTNLRSVKDKYSFEVEIAEPCYIIGMNSYEVQRVYSRTMDRFAFHHDRYDDFIPEMQYIGDQAIYGTEIDSTRPLTPFGYCLRNMEYKKRVSYASGGFVNDLPTWAFITDNIQGNSSSRFISPDFIRSSPSEFDRFYKSLNGYSLGTYYHFIVAHNNITAPARMMEYTPEILK